MRSRARSFGFVCSAALLLAAVLAAGGASADATDPNTPTLVDAIDPGDGFAVSLGLAIDPFTAGGLAALPVPEAPELLGGFAALACVVWLARARGRSTRRT